MVVGGWWQLAVVGDWWLVAVGSWRLVVGGVGGRWRVVVGGELGIVNCMGTNTNYVRHAVVLSITCAVTVSFF